jgi:ankyrin repeat protein
MKKREYFFKMSLRDLINSFSKKLQTDKVSNFLDLTDSEKKERVESLIRKNDSKSLMDSFEHWVGIASESDVGFMLLVCAVENNAFDCIKIINKKFAGLINQKVSYGIRSRHLVLRAVEISEEMVIALLEAGANPNSVDHDSISLLKYLVQNQMSKAVEVLINRGVNVKDPKNQKLVSIATKMRNKKLIELLVSSGFVDSDDSQTIFENYKIDNKDIVLKIINREKKKEEYSVNKEVSSSFLMELATQKEEELLLKIIDKPNINLDCQDTKIKMSFIELCYKQGLRSIVGKCIEKNVNLIQSSKSNRHLIFGCIEERDEEMALKILSHGLSVNTVDYDSECIIRFASHYNCQKVFDYIINHKEFNPNQFSQKRPLIMCYMEAHKEEEVIELLKRGANINTVDFDGDPIIRYSIQENLKRVYEELVMRQANINVEGHTGRPVIFELAENNKFHWALLDLASRTNIEIEYNTTSAKVSLFEELRLTNKKLLEKLKSSIELRNQKLLDIERPKNLSEAKKRVLN